MNQEALNGTLDAMHSEAWSGFISFTGTAGWYAFDHLKVHKSSSQMAAFIARSTLELEGVSRSGKFWESELLVYEYEKLLRDRRVDDPYHEISAKSLYGESWLAFPAQGVGVYMIGYVAYAAPNKRLRIVPTSIALCGCPLSNRAT